MKKVSLTLILLELGRQHRVAAIKELREATELGIRQAKDVVDALYAAPEHRLRVTMSPHDLGLLIAGNQGHFFYMEVRLESPGLDLTTMTRRAPDYCGL